MAEEFANIYVFHLRGNQRTSGERSKREGGKIFGSGSRTPVAITLLVKNPIATEQGRIHFHDIGDYLTREEKLAIVASFGSVGGVARQNGWTSITPDNYGDWLSQRDSNFDTFMPMGDKETKGANALFANYSRGLETGRDAWCFNASRDQLSSNIQHMIEFYNREVERFDSAHPNEDRKKRSEKVDGFVDTDPVSISWTSSLKADLVRGKHISFDQGRLITSLYRPFSKQSLYYSDALVHRVGQMPRIFPMRAVTAENQVIMVKQRQHEGSQFALMTSSLPELQSDGGTQCFPEYLYEADANVAEQSRAEQSRAEQSRAEQSRDYILH